MSALILTALWLLAPRRSHTDTEANVVEITYMAPGGPVSGAMDDAIREFERESRQAHLKDPSKPIYRVVSGQNASRNQTEDPTRFLLSVAGGMPPDVIYFDRFAVSEWASRGAFTPLDDFLARDAASGRADAIVPEDFFASCWNEAVYTDPLTGKKSVFGIPNGVDDRALFYNKDLLQRAGFSGPPKTWEELEEMAVKLTERDAKGRITRLGFVPNYGNSWLYIFGWMNGGEFMSADGRRCTLNDPKIVEALEFMTRIYDRLGGAQEVAAFQSSFQGGDLDPFLQGKIVMKITGYWELSGTMAQFGRDVNWGVAPPPMPAAEVAKGRTTLSWNGGWCYAIPSTAKNKDAGWELIRYLSSRRAIEVFNESQRLTVESQGRIFIPSQHPNRKINDWLVEKYVNQKPGMDPKVRDAVKVFNDLLPDARFRPVTPVGQLLWNQHITAMENGIYKKMSAQEALDRGAMIVQRELDVLLAPPKGRVVKWDFFFWLYGGLLIAAAVGIYIWDTKVAVRERFVAGLGPLGRFLKGKGAHLEGVQSSYFRSQWRGGWVCAMPWIFGFVVFTGGPILFSIIISFCHYDIMNPARFIGVDNYLWMFTKDPLFWKSLKNTLFMVIGIPLGMAVSLGIALLLNLKVRGIAIWRTFFYLPAIVPAVASSILWIWIFNPNAGLLNSVLASFGIQGPNWLQSEDTSKWSLILMGLWGAGGGMIIWLAGLKGISESYYEAASLDGAGTLKKFWYVTLPLLSPYIFFNAVMGLIGTFQIFTQAFIMTQGGPVDSTLFYAYHLFNNAFRYLQMGYAAAMAWFLFVIVFALTMVQMRISERWVHYEAE
jgi:ABC-type sugar transport system permease subunit/ABC-type glycerol-3-phosphate transport system substrate-binding protein